MSVSCEQWRRNANLVDVEWFRDKILFAAVDDDPVVIASALIVFTAVTTLQRTTQKLH